MKKIKTKLTAVIIFLLSLWVLAKFWQQNYLGQPPVSFAPPSPTPTKTKQPASFWATDPAVLAIEADLKAIGEEIKKTELNEPALRPPLLDMDINFEK